MRFTAEGQGYEDIGAADLPTGGADFSITIWGRIAVDRGARQTFWGLDSGGAINSLSLATGTDGTTVSLVTVAPGPSVLEVPLFAGTPGQLYHIVTRLKDNDTMEWSWNVPGGPITAGQDIDARWALAVDPTNLRIGESVSPGGWLNGSVFAFKLWNDFLGYSTGDLHTEQHFWLPLRRQNLLRAYPLMTADDANFDHSGNGHTLSGGVGASEEIGPPIKWSGGRARRVFAGLGGVMLAVQDASQAHKADSMVLTQGNVLQPHGASQGQTAESVDLTQDSSLQPHDAVHGQTADSVVLTQEHLLVVQGAQHDQATGNIVLQVGVTLDISESLHSQFGENVTLSISGLLQVASALHAHGVDNVVLTQANILAVAEALNAQSAANVILQQASALSIDGVAQSQAADSIVLSAGDLLAVAGAAHAQVAGSVELTQDHVLIVSSALHQQLAEALSLRLPGESAATQAVFVVEARGRIFVVASSDRTFNA